MNGINNIQLSGNVLAQLYSKNLVLIEEEKKAETIATKEVEWFLGSNKKQVTIIINHKTESVIDNDNLTFITNILTACKLTIDDVVIVNIHHKKISFIELIRQFNSHYLLLFNVDTKSINLAFSLSNYQIKIHNNCNIICADDMQLMNHTTTEAKLLKSKLWLSLKALFGI